MTAKHILIVCGESSGENLAISLVNDIRRLAPNIKISAMGGAQLKETGVEIIVDSTQLAVVGFWEVLTHFKQIRQAFHTVKNFIHEQKIDLVIFIDYPGFNLRMAKFAREYGSKVFYYVSPQIWAWKYGRIEKIKKYVDHMAVLFAFEEKIYQRENVPVSFVGHPLVNKVKAQLSKTEIYQKWNLNPEYPIITLFPGSRQGEIKRLLPTIVETVKLIRKRIPQAQFVLPLANTLNPADIKNKIPPDIKIIQNHIYDILSVATVAIAASGTVTLEIALMQTPLVIIYKISFITAVIAKLFLKIKHVGLCNIIAEEEIAKELLQYQATPTAISAEVAELINNISYRQNTLNKLVQLRGKLGDGQPVMKTAQAVLDLL